MAANLQIFQKPGSGAVIATSRATALFAGSDGRVETEMRGSVAADPGVGQFGEQTPEWSEQTCVRRRVGSAGPPDRLLVDGDDAVDLVDTGTAGERQRTRFRLVELRRQRGIQGFVDEAALSRPRDAGDGNECCERNLQSHISEIVASRFFESEPTVFANLTRSAGAQPPTCRGDVCAR